SGNNASRVFDVQGDVTVTIAGLTIANGHMVDGGGGGIANEAGATLSLINDTVANNTVYGIGGGLWNDRGAPVTGSGCTFTGNVARAGDGGAGGSGHDGGSGGQGAGGALNIDVAGTRADVSSSTFTNNQATGGAGGIGSTGHDGGAGGVGAGGALALA